MDLKEIQDIIKAECITALRIEYPDLYGICRSKMIPAKNLEQVAEEGLNFAQAIYAINLANDVAPETGCGYEIEWKDMTIMPDLSTFAVLPYLDGTARVIGNAFREGKPIPVDPRYALQRILKKYEEKGLRPVSASELEFFLYNLNAATPADLYNPNLSCVYQINPTCDSMGFLQNLQNTLLQLGIDVIYLNHEFFPSQYEINWNYDHALKMADQSFTYKYVCKELAALNNLHLTFMGRPTTDGGGSGYHIHLSLSDPKTRKNLFDDPNGKYGISDLMRYFIGGQMAHAKGMSALLAPTINSYKRYVPDSFAPYYLAWGLDNRTVYCRVPSERGSATRIENRAPCASANPYLAFAAAFAAGLDGIENKIEPGEHAVGDIYGVEPGTYETIPFYLRDALEELKADKVLCDAMGPELIQAFVALKEDELDRFRKHVTDWEFSEYSYQL
ncbi:MAG: glutamine synthetase [Desulfobacterales bacterium]|nr:glutamine synthetase family protein [Deltaproteobacteria bacterium]NNL78134.1 glutamine synthetase [Desulfobacterales bacterium]